MAPYINSRTVKVNNFYLENFVVKICQFFFRPKKKKLNSLNLRYKTPPNNANILIYKCQSIKSIISKLSKQL
jgi:hypothetical protein